MGNLGGIRAILDIGNSLQDLKSEGLEPKIKR
jgi:hypothetical protein